jgi:hypothetical protein
VKQGERTVGTGIAWRKSSRSAQGSECVEVATALAWTGVRDSKNPQAGHLVFDRPAFAGLLAALKNDLP